MQISTFSFLTKKCNWTNKRFQAQAGILFVVFSAALLAKIPVLKPSFRELLSPIGSQEVFSSLILYSAPFLFLLYCLITRGEHLRFSHFDLLYGLITLMHLISFFWINRGFQPINPVLTNICIFFLYLLVRNIHSHGMKDSTLFLLAIPIIPSVAEACHGLLQAVNGHIPVKGHFPNYNFLGMLLALSIPLAVSQIFPRDKGPVYRITALSLALFLFIIIIQTTSRTATCGVVLTLGAAFTIFYWANLKPIWSSWGPSIKIIAGSAALFSAGSGFYYIYNLRPLSVWGRIHLAKLGVSVFSDNFLTGIGFGEISSSLARHQSEYFAVGRGSELDRLLAGNPGAVTSEYLEAAVETGIFGLLLYIPFWFLILRMAFGLIRFLKSDSTCLSGPGESIPSLRKLGLRIWRGEQSDMVRFGVGAVLLLFMIMSIPYSPSRIMQINIFYTYILGIAVSLYQSGFRKGHSEKTV